MARPIEFGPTLTGLRQRRGTHGVVRQFWSRPGFWLDPLALIAGGAALDRAIDDVLANFADGRLIFILGHGIQPETPIAHVEQMLKRVQAYKG
jgi:hypothetical protein